MGRDVDEIVKDLMEAALTLTRTRLGQQLRDAAAVVVEEILLTALCGPQASPETYKSFRWGFDARGVDRPGYIATANVSHYMDVCTLVC